MYVVTPKITAAPENVTVINGNEAVFRCVAVGNPPPIIHWYISGVDLSIPNNMDALYDEDGRIKEPFVTSRFIDNTTVLSTLKLNITTIFEAGRYTCVPSNTLGSVNTTALLTTGWFCLLLYHPLPFILLLMLKLYYSRSRII